MKILLVDDSAVLTKMLKKSILHMAKDKVEVEMAYNAHEAVNLLKNNKFDLLVTDIVMPEINGVELIKRIREEKIELPICVYSSIRSQDILDELNALKVDLMLLKPGNMHEVCSKILNLIMVVH